MDVVLGGDHGQGKFRSLIKIILRDDAGKQLKSMAMKVGHIDCTKDTHEILHACNNNPTNSLQLGSLLQTFSYKCVEMHFPGNVRQQSLNNSQGETSIILPFSKLART
jgi:hypothetical protein